MFEKGMGIFSISVRSVDMMKQLVYPVLACLGILGCVVFHSTPEALSAECKTFSIHDPIYPGAGGNVTYTLLDVIAVNGVQSIELHEWVQDVDQFGNTSGGGWVKLDCWGPDPGCSTLPSSPPISVSHVKGGGNTSNKFISYKFKVFDSSGNPYPNSDIVGYAIRDYPPSSVPNDDLKQPAPVYVQGDVGQAMDIIFIPDEDITDLDVFRDHCRLMILEGIFGDEMTRSWWQFFNFYINPLDGDATTSVHRRPDNWNQLTFAETQTIMHLDVFRDHAEGTLFSTEQENRGTMLHEAGHALFGLADEYYGGGHWQLADYPNNWKNRSDARSEAPLRHRGPGDVRKIGRNNWYKICYTNCQMNNSGLTVIEYDLPCRDRVEFSIQNNAGIP
jgi:hypothetical protein